MHSFFNANISDNLVLHSVLAVAGRSRSEPLSTMGKYLAWRPGRLFWKNAWPIFLFFVHLLFPLPLSLIPSIPPSLLPSFLHCSPFFQIFLPSIFISLHLSLLSNFMPYYLLSSLYPSLPFLSIKVLH